MRRLLLLLSVLLLQPACGGGKGNASCDPDLNPGCELGPCSSDDPSSCRGSIYVCEDGQWVLWGYCDLPPYGDPYDKDAGMDAALPDGGPAADATPADAMADSGAAADADIETSDAGML